MQIYIIYQTQCIEVATSVQKQGLWGIVSTLSMDRVPPAILCDIAKEMIQGKFTGKLKASCLLWQTEPFTPWSNAAERNKRSEERFWEEDQVESTQEALE